jgi:Ca2+-binding EF-hand superfamily protein
MSRLKDYKYELSIDQEKKLKRVFKVYEDRSGIAKLRDILEGMREAGIDEKNPLAYDLISQLNTGDFKNGIKFEELISEINKKLADRSSEESIERLFQYFIQNSNKDKITVEELKRLADEVGEDISDDQAQRIMNKVSKNGKDLNFDEFYNIMTKRVQL